MKVTIEIDGKGIVKAGKAVKKAGKAVKKNAGPLTGLTGYFLTGSLIVIGGGTLLIEVMSSYRPHPGGIIISLIIIGIGSIFLFGGYRFSKNFQGYKNQLKEEEDELKKIAQYNKERSWGQWAKDNKGLIIYFGIVALGILLLDLWAMGV